MLKLHRFSLLSGLVTNLFVQYVDKKSNQLSLMVTLHVLLMTLGIQLGVYTYMMWGSVVLSISVSKYTCI